MGNLYASEVGLRPVKDSHQLVIGLDVTGYPNHGMFYTRNKLSGHSLVHQLGFEPRPFPNLGIIQRSEEHTSELQSLMRISYAVFCLKKQTNYHHPHE